jgi:parallel beta-helix repeat protein
MTNFTPGDVSASQILTDNDHLYPDHINELRQSLPFTAIVGLTSDCEYYCDGVNDNVEIQAALDAVSSAGGGLVFIKAGTYLITQPLIIDSKTTMAGEGWNTIIKLADNTILDGTLPIIDGVPGTAWDYGLISSKNCKNHTYMSDMVVRDLALDGNIDNQSITWLTQTNNLLGVYLAFNRHCLVSHVKVTNMGAMGICIWGDFTTNYTDSVIENCYVENCNEGSEQEALLGLTGIFSCGIFVSYGGKGTIIKGNTIKDCYDGIVLDDGILENIVSNNVVYSSTNTGIHCQNAGARTIFSNNMIRGCGGTGLSLVIGATGCVATGNFLYENKNGIEVANQITVIGNVCKNNDECGIIVHGLFSNVNGNVCIDNGQDDTADAGDRCGIKTVGTQYLSSITNNNVYDSQVATTQQYGIYNLGDSNLITGNLLNGNLVDFFDSGSANTTRGNIGWVTENSGTGTIASGTTSKVITHGLSVTPTLKDISITLGELSTADPGQIYVTAIGATTFTVNCRTNPGVSGLDFAWQAIVL